MMLKNFAVAACEFSATPTRMVNMLYLESGSKLLPMVKEVSNFQPRWPAL